MVVAVRWRCACSQHAAASLVYADTTLPLLVAVMSSKIYFYQHGMSFLLNKEHYEHPRKISMSISSVETDNSPFTIRRPIIYYPQVDPGNYIIQQDHEINGVTIPLEAGMLFVFRDLEDNAVTYEHWILYESVVGGWPEGKVLFQFPSPGNPKLGFHIIYEEALGATTKTPHLQDTDVFGHEALLKANKITAKYILATCVAKPKVGFALLDIKDK